VTPDLSVVYDDSLEVPAEVSSLTGVTRFGDMLRRRERLSSTVRSLAHHAGVERVVHARSGDDLAQLAESARRHRDSSLYLVLPSNLAPTAEQPDAVLFLKKLRYLTEPVCLWDGDRPTGACMMDRDSLQTYVADAAAGERERFVGDYAARRPPVDDALRLADLSELAVALEFLSGSFSARHFNQIAHQDRYYVVKRSSDAEKMRREYDVFGLLPDALKPFFVQPFDFSEDADGASYRMRRLFVPDLAVQWVHHAFTETQFAQMLEHVFHFVDVRPRRDVGADAARKRADELYVDKLDARISQLLSLPAGQAVDDLLVTGGVAGGVRTIQSEYMDAYAAAARSRRYGELAQSHGDLCFSNILYSPSTQMLHLIDPRGATELDETFLDPYYDVAKLSHSVLGGYDFMVAGMYELAIAEDLSLRVEVDRPASEELRSLFLSALERHGFDPSLVRLYEASLFLSMLPLHIDMPKRAAAFALRAREILAAR
jgi:hypothetical protein